jgi:hypothetical protein
MFDIDIRRYLIITAAATSLLSMSLVLWRIVNIDCCCVIKIEKIEFLSKQYRHRGLFRSSIRSQLC